MDQHANVSLALKVANKFCAAYERGRIKVDLGGHYRGGRGYAESFYEDLFDWSSFRKISADQLAALNDVLDGKRRALRKEVEIKLTRTSHACYECGKGVTFRTNGRHYTADQCDYPGGIPAFEFELNVPSGTLVVGNDYRSGFKVIGDYYINHTFGVYKTTMKYADVGLAHSFVGNTCPGVYRDPARGKDRLIIGRRGDNGRSPAYRQREVAGVCTDLWWYSIADLDEWRRRMVRDIDHHYDDLVKVRPGVYKFTHQYHLLDHDSGDPLVYTYIDWVREPDPVRDFQGEFDALDCTAGQVVCEAIRKYPSLYDHGDPTASCAAVASQIFCTIGGGYDWHPNGWSAANPDLTPDSPAVDIPIFDRAFHWYPLSDYSAIQAVVGESKSLRKPNLLHLNDSFLDLAWNVVQSIIRHGSVVTAAHTSKDEEHAKAEQETNLMWARRWARGLADRWPERVPEYCRDLI